jgi:AhpD family alkylhydroperoxidase
MSILSDKEREAVAIGAAIGAGCRPCTQYHVKAAMTAGLSQDEVRLAVDDAEVVRLVAVTAIAGYARHLLGDEEQPVEYCDPTTADQALAQIGAATGGNAGYILESLLPRGRSLGLSDDTLAEAVQVAGKIKQVAANFFRQDAERALADRREVAAPADAVVCAEVNVPVGAGCAPAPRAVPAEAARSGNPSCC